MAINEQYSLSAFYVSSPGFDQRVHYFCLPIMGAFFFSDACQIAL
jgi:hypothetical protein